ncbi:MAG: OmpH family outer membrane protein [Alistipes sp.]|nr:OmpH family outer membrane protein [Alistipes sp.]MBO7262399.1 OmpH family outer membrane protein [Alistipes sp.]
MKKFVKLTLAVALLFIGASAANAQQFGRVDLTAIIPNMPEYQEADKNLAEYGKDLQDQLEQMQVEFNQKLADYQKNANTYSDAIRQTKESELQQLDQRLREFQQIAYQDLQKKQNELMAPIIEKANNAVNAVAKEGGYIAIFNTEGDMAASAGLAYFDPEQLTNITEAVAKKLGVEIAK